MTPLIIITGLDPVICRLRTSSFREGRNPA